MEYKNNRLVNTLICVAGLVLCIVSGILSAPEGILDDEAVNVIHALSLNDMLLYYALPALLMMLATILVADDRLRVIAFAASIAGTVIFTAADASFMLAGQVFPGIMMNAAGSILVITGASLLAFATKDRKIAEEEIRELEEGALVVQPSAFKEMYLDPSEAANVSINSDILDDEIVSIGIESDRAEPVFTEGIGDEEFEKALKGVFADIRNHSDTHQDESTGIESISSEIDSIPAADTDTDTGSDYHLDISGLFADAQVENQQLPDEGNSAVNDEISEKHEGDVITDFDQGLAMLFDENSGMAAIAASVTVSSSQSKTPSDEQSKVATDFYSGIADMFLNNGE